MNGQWSGQVQWIMLGAVVGAVLAGLTDAGMGALGGAASGAVLGALPAVRDLLGKFTRLSAGVEKLTARVDTLARQQQALYEEIARLSPVAGSPPQPETFALELDPPPAPAVTSSEPVMSPETARSDEAWETAPGPGAWAKQEKPARKTTLEDRLQAGIWKFFSTGNVVARGGSIVLFFGLAFLLKHAAGRMAFPIEIRLVAVAALGLGLLAAGWYLRRRQGYGLILQGAGIGTLYLTTFTALRFYNLMPDSLAFGLMLVIVVLAVALALLQDSRALVTLGTAGGFMAPILTSSGDGNHVLLFSYYALLNTGILAVAWHRAWRSLNLLGFAFTFVIGALWGHEAYQPDLFATTQPFLALFFLFYLAITVLFAHRQPPELKGYIDGTLVFGVPLTAFALQAALVWDFEYGLAYSALAAALVYASLAGLLWRRHAPGLQLLIKVFLVLGGLLATLAIPFAFDNQVTAAAWALEGAALVWLGIRQGRRLVSAGLLLQLTAGIAFSIVAAGIEPGLPLLNGLFLGGLILSLAGLWSSTCLEQREGRYGRSLAWTAMGWGLIWWLVAGFGEIERHLSGAHVLHATVLWLAISAIAMDRLSRRLSWAVGAYPAIGLFPALALIALGFHGALLDGGSLYARSGDAHLLSSWGLPAWLCAGGAHLYLLHRRSRTWPSGTVQLWHMGGLWLALFIGAHKSFWWVSRLAATDSAWALSAWALAPTLALYCLSRYQGAQWPMAGYRNAYRGNGLLPIAACLSLWTILSGLAKADPDPLPYLPLLNPMELTQGLVLLVLAGWWLRLWQASGPFGCPRVLVPAVIGTSAFVALTGALARSVHHFADVPHSSSALFDSIEFQTGLSILWCTLALGLMGLSARRNSRNLWYVGAALLGLVVIKLFLVELASTGTIGRIVSFLAVGLLMLLIGFLAPLPPGRRRHSAAE